MHYFRPVQCPHCRKKVYTREAAHFAARRLQRKDGDRMMIYPCPYAPKKMNVWHVGHIDPKEGADRRRINGVNGKGPGRILSGLPVPSNRVTKDVWHDDD